MVPESIRIAPPVFDVVSAYGIGGLAVVVAVAVVLLFSRARQVRRMGLAAGAAIVMATSAAAASSGVLARFDRVPPPMFVMIVSVFVMAFALGFSRIGADAAAEVPLAAIVGLQAFRLPLELVMHRAFTLGIMPEELTYSRYNFDIVTGAGAALLFMAMRTGWRVPAGLIWAWNLWGFWCLAVITVIAVTTSPVLRLFGDEPRHLNTFVLFFPYVWLPVVLVTVALSSHIVITRALRRGSRPV